MQPSNDKMGRKKRPQTQASFSVPDGQQTVSISDNSGIWPSHVMKSSSYQTSRYNQEFQELGRLGKGGFGSVYKARNHLDGGMYAVKKIRFRPKSEESPLKLLREVKALAKLSHTRIVRYNAAWMQDDSPTASVESASTRTSRDDDNSPSSTEEYSSKRAQFEDKDSDSRVFTSAEDSGVDYQSSRFQSITSVYSGSVDFGAEEGGDGPPRKKHAFQHSFDAASSPKNYLVPVGDVAEVQGNFQCKNTITLYIQMELCSATLQNWMGERNIRLQSDQDLLATSSEIMRVFHEILEGVDYIHSQDIMHRDLKVEVEGGVAD